MHVYVCMYICLNGDELCMLKPEINFCSVLLIHLLLKKILHTLFIVTFYKKTLYNQIFFEQNYEFVGVSIHRPHTKFINAS